MTRESLVSSDEHVIMSATSALVELHKVQFAIVAFSGKGAVSFT